MQISASFASATVNVEKRTALLLGTLGATVAAFVFSRTQTGSNMIADAIDGIARGIRNNNPGNIEWIADPARRWRGMVSQDGRFGVFDTPANGIRAIGGELRASIRKGQTLAQAIHEWAPAFENLTDAYLSHVEQVSGYRGEMRLTAGMIPGVAEGIILHENGSNPYSRADIARWSQMS